MTSAAPETPLTRRELRARKRTPRKRMPREPVPRKTKTGRVPLAKRIFSLVALLFVGGLIVGTSLPATAVPTPVHDSGGSSVPVDAQSLNVADSATEVDATRAKFSASSFVERIAAVFGASSNTFTPTTGAVRWPFPYSTTITDGFGPRKSPCAGCSTFHKGTDFTPGAGVPVYAIASGTVETSIISNAGLGNQVLIDHGTINGEHIESLYGHLQMNSSPLKAGDTVKVGDLVGKEGATGTTTGANMHLEVHVNGVAVDPFKWLTANATDTD